MVFNFVLGSIDPRNRYEWSVNDSGVQCVSFIAVKSADIYKILWTHLWTCQLGAFHWKYDDAIGDWATVRREIWFIKYPICNHCYSIGNWNCEFYIFPHVQLMGASGVVFAFILLSSFTSIREGTIPVTFILVAVIYIGGQVYDGVFVRDNVSNLTHILGGGVGSALGYVMAKTRWGDTELVHLAIRNLRGEIMIELKKNEEELTKEVMDKINLSKDKVNLENMLLVFQNSC